jgi:Ca2+-transporting ATPase
MERAILSAAGAEAHGQRRSWTLEHDYPMTPQFLAVCHAWRSPAGERIAAIKGAPETVLAQCRINNAAIESATAEVERAAARGLRLLAVAEAQSRSPIPCARASRRRSRSAGARACASS